MTPHRRRPLRARNVPTKVQVGGRDVAMQDLTPWTFLAAVLPVWAGFGAMPGTFNPNA